MNTTTMTPATVAAEAPIAGAENARIAAVFGGYRHQTCDVVGCRFEGRGHYIPASTRSVTHSANLVIKEPDLFSVSFVKTTARSSWRAVLQAEYLTLTARHQSMLIRAPEHAALIVADLEAGRPLFSTR